MKQKITNLFSILLAALLLFISCKKHTETVSDLDTLRNNSNKKSYPITTMDSVEAINYITKQKVQELLDLSTLYSNGNKNTEIDTVIYNQMQSYFAEPDSSNLSTLIQELQNLRVKKAKVNDLNTEKRVMNNDTLDFAKFHVEYFDKANKSLGKFTKEAQYTLQLAPVRFKKEFKFYFINFDQPINDTTSIGVTK